MYGIKRDHPIFVSNEAFDKLGIEELFLNTLIDHEGFHTSDLKYDMQLTDKISIDSTNIKLLQPRTFIALREIRAYKNQLEQTIKKGINHSIYLKYHQFCPDWENDELIKITPANNFEGDVIEACLSPSSYSFSKI